MQEGISLQQVLSYLFLTVPISLAGVIFTNSSIFREGKKIKIASELNIFKGSLTRAHWHECALTIFCHETCKIKTLPLAMLKLNSPFLLLNYLIPQCFILGLTFFPALMSITHTLHLSAHPNVPGTSAWPWDQVYSPNSLRNIIIILRGLLPCFARSFTKTTNYCFLKAANEFCPSHPQSDPEHSFWASCCSTLLAGTHCICHRVCSRVSASAWSSVLTTVMAQSFWRKQSITFYLNQIHCLPGFTGKTVHKRHRLWI